MSQDERRKLKGLAVLRKQVDESGAGTHLGRFTAVFLFGVPGFKRLRMHFLLELLVLNAQMELARVAQ